MKAGKKLIKGMFAGSSFGEVVRMLSILGSGGSSSIEKELKKKKQKYLFVGLVCVREEYQGQGYMRNALELAFAEGNRLGLPVVLDTDVKLKSDKYRHLGMELAGIRTCKNGSKLYELIKNPKLLLCDEPTAALDSKTSRDILILLEEINEKYGTTMLIVMHNNSIKNMVHKVLIIKDGLIHKSYENEVRVPARELEDL